MVKMILSAPHGFDAVKFLNLASELSRARYSDDYDLDLGEYISPRDGTLYLDEYELDAEDITLEQIEIICELQTLCTLVNIHFENTAEPIYRTRLDLFTDIVNAHHDAVANA